MPDIVGADGHTGCDRGDAGIAGRAKQRVAQRRIRDLPTEGVLPSAAAHHKHSHPSAPPLYVPGVAVA